MSMNILVNKFSVSSVSTHESGEAIAEKEDRIIITMSMGEAKVLRSILGNIGGGFYKIDGVSPATVIQSLYIGLAECDVDTYGSPFSNTMKIANDLDSQKKSC